VITPKKLKTLKEENRWKKIAYLARDWKGVLEEGGKLNTPYIKEVMGLLPEEEFPREINSSVKRIVHRLGVTPPSPINREELVRALDTLSWKLLEHIGTTPGDWDLFRPGIGPASKLDEKTDDNRNQEILVYLEDIRSPFNVGSMFRICEAFGVKEIILSPSSSSPLHHRARKTARGCIDRVPWRTAEPEEVPETYPLLALETGGVPLSTYTFPSAGIVFVGSEELGLRATTRNRILRQGTVVSIPMRGKKGSLNVGVALGIFLYQWSLFS